MNINEEKALGRHIDRIVRDIINEAVQNADEKKEKKGQSKSHRVQEIIQWLKDDQVNNAALARILFPDLSDDAARSLFSKKVRGHDNKGKSYSFSDDEIAHLYNLKGRFITKISESRQRVEREVRRYLSEQLAGDMAENDKHIVMGDKHKEHAYILSVESKSGNVYGPFEIHADDFGDEALCYLASFLTQQGFNDCYYTDEEVQDMAEREGFDGDIQDWGEEHGLVYTDGTMEGATIPVWIDLNKILMTKED